VAAALALATADLEVELEIGLSPVFGPAEPARFRFDVGIGREHAARRRREGALDGEGRVLGRSLSHVLLLRGALLAQLAVEIVEADARAFLAAGNVVVAVEEDALLGEDQPRAAAHGEELDGRERD
jgi:hypothetical protein